MTAAWQRAWAGAFVAASTLLSALPRAITLPAARALGRAAWWALPVRRRIALENLEATIGVDMDSAARRRLAIASFGHAAAIAVDLLTLPRVARDPRRHCDVSPGSLDVLRRARDRGRGVILVAGHFGLFESMGILLGHEGFPVTFVAKPFDNPWLDEAVNARRSLTGNSFLHKGGAKARAREILAAGGMVAIVVDQHVGSADRLWVPFLGLPAATTRSLGTLALDSGAPIVPIHSYPLSRGRCRCEFGPEIRADGKAGDAAAAEALVARAVAEMDAATRRQPEAWLWLHRRWKVRPHEAQGRYPPYSITEAEERRRGEARFARAAGSRAAR